MICVFLVYDGNSRRLNRKWFNGEAGNRTCDPWFTMHSFCNTAYNRRGWNFTIFRLYIIKLIKFFELYYSVNYTAKLFIYY